MIDARRRLPAPAPSAAPARGPAAAQPGGPGLHGRTRDAAGATQTRPARTQTHRPAARSAPPGPRRWRTRLEPAMRLRDSRAHPRFDRSGRVPHHLGLGPPALRYAASVAHRLLRNASRRLAPWRPPDAPLRPRQADIPPEARPQPETPRCGFAPRHPHPSRHAARRVADPHTQWARRAARLAGIDEGQPRLPRCGLVNADAVHKDIHSRLLSDKPGGPAITRDKCSCPQQKAGRRVGIFPGPRLAS